jgi:hypothetical protein
MVGPPKRLEDLHKVDGAVRITCRSCRAVRTIGLPEVITARQAAKLSTDWEAVRHGSSCPECESRDVRVDGVPFGDRNPEVLARRAAIRRLHLALQVLNDGAPRTSTMPLPAIQLALRVLYPYLGDRELLLTYWQQITGDKDRLWGGAHQALRWIVTRLIDRGWPVAAEFR